MQFFREFNGVSVFQDRLWIANEDIQLFNDSAGSSNLGFGAYFGIKWTYGAWPESLIVKGITEDITVLELFPLLVALQIWGDDLRNKKILFRVDNLAVVHIVNSMTSKSDNVMTILRAFTLRCLQLNIAVKAQHLSGCSNTAADALSRFQFQKFRELVPGADPCPTPVPDQLYHLFLNSQKLLTASLAYNSQMVYDNALLAFKTFHQNYSLTLTWPSPVEHVILFISYCFDLGYSLSTISTYISGIGFFHKLRNLEDPTAAFIVKKLLEGCRRSPPVRDVCAPLTGHITKNLLCIARSLLLPI